MILVFYIAARSEHDLFLSARVMLGPLIFMKLSFRLPLLQVYFRGNIEMLP